MLLKEQLNKIAVRQQASFVNVAREYAQNIFLKYFYSLEMSEKYLFKGGTALRILFKSPRYSEDLDFSAISLKHRDAQAIIEEVAEKSRLEGILVEIKESYPTTGGFIAVLSVTAAETKLEILIEISARKKEPKGEIVLVDNPYIDSYTIMALKREELILEKISALENREKPRDFFDLYFMLRSNLLPERKVLRKLLPIILETKIDFKKELTEFLPVSSRGIIKDFKKTLISEVKRYV